MERRIFSSTHLFFLGEIMTIVTVGIDRAKNVFAVHCVDATDKSVLLKPSVPRAKLAALIASLPPRLIGMEACSGAHLWARTTLLMRPLSAKLLHAPICALFRSKHWTSKANSWCTVLARAMGRLAAWMGSGTRSPVVAGWPVRRARGESSHAAIIGLGVSTRLVACPRCY